MTVFALEIHVCLSQRKKSLLAVLYDAAPPPFAFPLLCALSTPGWSHSRQEGGHGDLTSQSPEEGSVDRVYHINPGDLNQVEAGLQRAPKRLQTDVVQQESSRSTPHQHTHTCTRPLSAIHLQL